MVFEEYAHAIRFHFIKPKNKFYKLQNYDGQYDSRQKKGQAVKKNLRISRPSQNAINPMYLPFWIIVVKFVLKSLPASQF
jgi:hypothetical protein